MPTLTGPNGGTPTVLPGPNLALVFWGQFWVDHPDFVQAGTRFFVEFVRGHNVDGLVQYGIQPASICWAGTNTQANPSNDPDFIADVLAAAIKSGSLPQPTAFQNLVYVFIGDPTWPGILGKPPAAQHWLSTATGNYQGGISFLFLYSLMSQAEINAATLPGMTGQAWWTTQATEFTALLSHELYEIFTDPNDGSGLMAYNYPKPGTNSECCDICNDDLGKPLQSIGPWTIESYWSNQDNQCINGYANAWTSYGSPTPRMSGPPAVGKQANGTAMLFAVGSDGNLYTRTLTTGVAWTRIGGGNLIGPPVVAFNPTLNLLEVFAVSGDGTTVLHTYQTAPNGSWSEVQSLGGPAGTSIMGVPAVTANAPSSDGYPALELFVIGSDGNLHHIWQLGPSAGWSGWGDSLGAPPPGIAAPVIEGNISGEYSGPSVVGNQDGRLEVFLLSRDGAVWHRWQTAANGTWGDWGAFPISPSPVQQTSGSWVCGHDSDGRLELFVMCTDGNVYHIYQVNPNGGWSAWSSLMPLNIPAALPFNGLPAVVSGTDGNLPIQVFTVAADGSLWGISQSPPDAGWAPWRYLASPQNGAIPQYQHPAVVVQAGGALSVFVLGPDGNVWGLGQTAAAGPWGPLVTLGS